MQLPNRPNRRVTPDQVQTLLSIGYTLSQCGRELGVNSRTIGRVVARYKLKRKLVKWSRLTADQKKVILKMLKNGLPATYVASRFDRAYKTIWAMAKKYGIKLSWNTTNSTRWHPISEREIADYLNTMIQWVKEKYCSMPADMIQTAVHVGAAELRLYPRPKNWLGFWRQIAERRLVDMVREQYGKSGKKGEVLMTKRSRLVENDLADIPIEDIGLKEEIQKLPNELRRILSAVLRYGGPVEAQKELGISEGIFYVKLREAYSLLRSRLETAG